MADNNIVLKVSLDGAQKEISNLEQIQKSIKVLADEKKRLNKNEKELTAAINQSGVATKEQNEQLKRINAQQVQNNTSLKLAKTSYRENEQQVIRNTKAQQSNTGSLVQMRAQLAKDQRAYDLLTKSERENEKVGGRLQKSIQKQSQALKGLEKNTGRAQRNVGNYGEAMNDVLPIMGGFGGQIMTVQRSLGAMKSAIAKTSAAQTGMTATTKASSKGLKAFRIALISTGIGAIVVALGTLIAAFASTQRGVDALTSVLRPLQEIFQSIIGFTQDLATSGLDKLKKAFNDPKQAAIDLGNAIKENLITRILAVPKLIKAAAGAYINSFKLIGLGIKKVLSDVPLIGKFIDKEQLEKDLKTAKDEVKNSFSELKDASIELTVGVDADKVKEAGAKAGKFFSDAAARGSEIDRLTKQIEIGAINLNRELKKGERIFQEQRAIADDINAGAEKQIEAAAKGAAQLKINAKLEQDQLNLQLKLAKLKTEANDTDREAQKEIQDLIAQKEEVEAKALKKGLLLRNKANSVAKKAETDRIKAIEKEEKAQEKAADDKVKAESKAIDKKIELLKLERQLELATIDETNEQKIAKEKELLDTIGALRVEKAKLNGEDVATVKLENKIAEAEKDKEVQAVIDEEEKERLQQNEDFKQEIRSQGVDLAAQAGKAIIDGAVARSEREKEVELANLNAKLENGIISQEDFEAKKLQIEKKAFNKKKKLDIAIIAIDLAKELSAIAAAAAANPSNALTFGGAGVSQAAILGGIAIARSGVQAGIVASQKFSRGGVLNGASHAQGGVNLGNNQEGEGGEAIINKRSTAKHLGLLSAINQDGGGVALTNSTPNFSSIATKFANGGVGNFSGGSQIDLTDLESRITSAMGAIKVQNVASETTGVANRVQQIEDSASF